MTKDNPLNIVAVSKRPERSDTSPPKTKPREEAQAKFERMWLQDPQQFNPQRNEMERERIRRTLTVLSEYFVPKDAHVVDLGCGHGDIAQQLAKSGAHVLAIDIANNALKRLNARNIPNITTLQDYVPKTKLKDNAFNLAISTELIGYLAQDQFRLYFSELARVIRADGYVLCSTAIDINSDESLARFASLAESEFHILKWFFSYHAFYIRLLNGLTAPARFARAFNDCEYRQQELAKRTSTFRKGWYRLNTSPIAVACWKIVQSILNPLVKWIEQSPRVLLNLEKICRFIKNDAGISHAIFIGERRPIFVPPPEAELPQERKHRKQVWE